jgi:hypothetical protein
MVVAITPAGNTINSNSTTNTAPNQAPVPTGETPLAGDPNSFVWGQGQWQGRGGGQTAAQYYAWKNFAQNFGRNPTQQELDQLTPAYLSGDPNVANTVGGNAAVASYYTQQQNTPQNIYQQQQKQYQDQSGQYGDQVSSAFQSTLGRAPTQAEQQYFGALMASGQGQYQVQQALQQTQEYQNTQNTNFQNTLQKQLQDSNSTYFNQYIAPSLQAQNALSGQTPGSSALSSQLSQAALQQNQGLQTYLAGVSSQNYGNSVANASNQYNQLMGQQYGLQNAGVSNSLNNQASNTAYNQQLNLYQMQQQAYNNYLQNYGKTNGIGSALQGAIGGAAAGSKFGPWGAVIGGAAGGAAGYGSAKI